MIIETKGGNIVSGKDEFFGLLLTDGKRRIERYYRKRTNDQNKYLHALFGNIAKDVGEELDYIKRYFKNQFLKGVSNKKGVEYLRETSSLNTVEFAEFTEKILNTMSEFGYIYPTPEEYKKGKEFNSK